MRHCQVRANGMSSTRSPVAPSAAPLAVGENPSGWAPGALAAEALPVVLDVAGASFVSFSGNLSVRHGAANLEAYCISRGAYAARALEEPRWRCAPAGPTATPI